MAEKRWRTSGGSWEKLKPQSRRMRKEPTEAEAILWKNLRRKGLDGMKFRRQHPIGRFIVDFYCPPAKLVVEADGEIHNDTLEADRERQGILEAQGYRVIRFSNSQITGNIDLVLEGIKRYLQEA